MLHKEDRTIGSIALLLRPKSFHQSASQIGGLPPVAVSTFPNLSSIKKLLAIEIPTTTSYNVNSYSHCWENIRLDSFLSNGIVTVVFVYKSVFV